ncbi:TlpA disulfide reductase family protein [Microbacterium sp.]|uniref:TlpA disulfide reductase family protein n=1 Tax=Microbacterium sp. TaxID=51671 RepID=UPI003A837469
MTRRIVAVLAAFALAAGLSACTSENDGLASQYRSGSNQGYISGDGSVEEIPPEQRGGTVEFAGTDTEGTTIRSEDSLGEVTVVNFWYALCGPCRTEAPLLEEVYQATAADGVAFLGANIYDGPEQATAFEEKYGITYPSMLLRGDADLKLSFAAETTLQAAPTTLVLDREGRVAARFIGAVQSASILRTVVTSVAEEGS